MAVFFFTTEVAFDGAGNSLACDKSGDTLLLATGANFPNPWRVDCKLLQFASDLTPPMGGLVQRPERLGSRWSVTFSQTPALGVTCAQAILAARTKARANGDSVFFAWPQPTFSASIGAPAVNGAGQLGTRLIVNGLTPSTPLFTAGTMFSFTAGSWSYLHMLTANAVVDGSGNSTLQIAPMLRASPPAGTLLSVATPQIQGFIQGASEDWTLERLAWTGLPPFTVKEAR